MGLAVVLVFASLVLACVGAALWAWRGKRVDDHPLCRKCGFDLTGKPADSTRCAECGADMNRPRAVRVGHRKTRGKTLAASSAVLFLLVALGISLGVLTARKVNLNPYKPLWLLAYQFEHPAGPDLRAVDDELKDRLLSGKVDGHLLLPMADRLLAKPHPWSPTVTTHWGDMLVRLRHVGALDDARWKRFLALLGDLDVDVRPDVEAGDPVPIRVSARLFCNIDDEVVSEATVKVFLADDENPLSTRDAMNPQQPFPLVFATASVDDRRALSRPVGDVELRVRVTVDVFGRSRDPLPNGGAPPATKLLSLTRERKALVRIQPKGEVVKATPVAQLGAANASLGQLTLRIFPVSGTTTRRVVQFWAGSGLPFGLSHRAFLEVGGQRFPLGDVTTAPGNPIVVTGAIGNDAAGPAALILEPDRDLATRTTDIVSYGDVTLRIEGFTLENATSTTAPTPHFTVRIVPPTPKGTTQPSR